MKRTLSIVIYLLAFAAHLIPIQAFRQPATLAYWRGTLTLGRGATPMPGTETMLATLQYWWLYPLIAVLVFGYYLVYRGKLVMPPVLMTAVALIWWGYFYGPIIKLGAPI